MRLKMCETVSLSHNNSSEAGVMTFNDATIILNHGGQEINIYTEMHT